VNTAGDEAGDVRHVRDHRRTYLVRDAADPREIDHPRVRAGPHHDHLRLVLLREPLEGLVIEALVVLPDPVRDDRVELPREIEGVSVREVAPVRQVHAEHRVAGLQEREVHRHVRLRARVRLHVGVVGSEQRLRPIHGEALDDVGELAAAVIPLARVPLGVLVGEDGPGRLENGPADEVLRRNELKSRRLAPDFVADRVGDVGVRLPEAAAVGDHGVVHVGASLCSSLVIFWMRGSWWPSS